MALMLRPLQTQQNILYLYVVLKHCPSTKQLQRGNEELQVLLWNTKDGTAERIWVFEHLDTE